MKNLIHFLCIIVCLTLLVSCAGQKSAEVNIVLPMKAKFETKDYKHIYFTNLYVKKDYKVDQVVEIDPNEEIILHLKSQLSNLSDLKVKDFQMDYASITDQNYEKFVKNPDTWKNLNIEDKRSSLIFTGKVEFSNQDASGFFPREITDARTGITRTINIKEDKIEVGLGLDIYVISAETGEILYKENFKETSTFYETRKVTLPMFYVVFDRFEPKLVNILIPFKIKGHRFLITQ